MSEMNQEPGLSLDLSRAELLTVLGVMEAQFIPGLAPAQATSMTLEEAALAEQEAALVLQERELAQTDEDGNLLVHRAVLTLVGTCAYSQSALIAYHWQTDQEAPVQFFGHVRGEDVVAHTVPAESMHRFGQLASKEALVGQALATCHVDGPVDAPPMQLLIPRDVFDRARDLANQGNAAGAMEALSAAGVDEDAAASLSAALAAAPSVSAMQTIKQQDSSVRTREFTLVQDTHSLWLVMPTDVDPASRLMARTVGASELRSLLTDWL
jgi:hypothetical protein